MSNLEDKLKAKGSTQGQVVSRPATREDILAFSSVVKWPTAKAWIGEVDGEVVALGGFACIKGRWIGFIDVTEKGREYLTKSLGVRAAMIRAMMEGMREAKRMGIRYVYAEADTQFPKARELIERMGFHVDPRSPALHRWTPNNGSD
jgi:RimJ/RimL family protein N-acetyltransferase